MRRFSLRTLMIFVFVCALGLAFFRNVNVLLLAMLLLTGLVGVLVGHLVAVILTVGARVGQRIGEWWLRRSERGRSP